MTTIKVLDASGPPGLPSLLGGASEVVVITAISALSFSLDGETWVTDFWVVVDEEGDTSSGELALVPSGLLALLEHFKQNYGNPPIYIHENGQRTWKNATLSDPGRVKYIQSFTGSLLDAMRNGSNARRYFYWSFMDLFELLDGYESCYGLYYVDLKDKDLKRYPKLSAHWYSNFLKGQSMNLNGATEVQKKINSTLSQSHSSQ